MNRLSNKFSIRSDLARAMLGEFIGTALLLIMVCGIVAQSVLSRGKVNEMININIGVGLAVVFGIAICAKMSGGHINPAVTIMFVVFRQTPLFWFFYYAIAQTAGAFVGAAVIALVYRDAINDFDGGIRQVVGPKATASIYASYPGAYLTIFGGFLDQMIGTAVFCFLIAHITDKRNNYPKYMQPILIGVSFIMIGTSFGLNCGYPLNPARDFAPRFYSLLAGYGVEVFSFRHYGWFWVPIIAPLVGGVIGGVLYQLTIGLHMPSDDTECEVRKYEVVKTDDTKPLTEKKLVGVVTSEQ